MIRFGTSGWRGVVSDDFTFQNVRKVAHSVAGCVKESTEVGYNSDEYRQFLAGHEYPASVATSPRFYATLLALFRAIAPLIAFLNEPLLRAPKDPLRP